MKSHEKSILVALDFSPCSERALTVAVDLASQLGAKLQVVHIFEPLTAFAPPLAAPLYTYALDQLDEEQLRQRNQCIELCQRVVDDRIPYTLHVFNGMAIDGLLTAIGNLKPELVVIGSHGRGMFMQVLLGSVSTALCSRSPVPVVVVPPIEHAAPVTKETAPASSAQL